MVSTVTGDSHDSPSPGSTRRSWGDVADVVGHCVLVFAFVPALAALPQWLAFEAINPFNRQDAIALAFVPARGLIALLDAFADDVGQRVLAGALAGVLLAALSSRTSRPRQRVLLGALCGALAAGLAALALVVSRASDASLRGPVLFAIASGAVCGVIAAPTVHRFLGVRVGADATPLVTSVR
jgi:hypothetical protein